jgi:hypothetical protein
MGYTTEFTGTFKLNKKLDEETHRLLVGLSETRRVARNIEGYGVEGEFYVDGSGFAGQNREANIIDYNRPPKTQPGLWCNWTPTEDGMEIKWNGAEKFYYYVEWIEYLLNKVLLPRGYSLHGAVAWRGEEEGDLGAIQISKGVVRTLKGEVTYK